MTVEIYPEDEEIIKTHLARGGFGSPRELIHAVLRSLPAQAEALPPSADRRFEPAFRRDVVRRMKEFGQRHQLSFGEPITRKALHENHRF